MLIATSHSLVLGTLLLQLAHALPAPRPATTAPALPRDTEPAEVHLVVAPKPTPAPIIRYRRRSATVSAAHQWSGPKGINLLAHEEGSDDTGSGTKSSSSPTSAKHPVPSSPPSGFKIKTAFGTINCNLGGGFKGLFGGGGKEKGEKGSGHGNGHGEDNEDHEDNEDNEDHDDSEDHEDNQDHEEDQDQNEKGNMWDDFVSSSQNIWQSNSWNSHSFDSQTWQSDEFESETWQSDSWSSTWSSFNTWSSQWGSSNGWSSSWFTFDSWTSGATDGSDMMTTLNQESASNGFSSTWGSSEGWSSDSSESQTFSVEEGFTMITKTNSAGEAQWTMVPIG